MFSLVASYFGIKYNCAYLFQTPFKDKLQVTKFLE